MFSMDDGDVVVGQRNTTENCRQLVCYDEDIFGDTTDIDVPKTRTLNNNNNFRRTRSQSKNDENAVALSTNRIVKREQVCYNTPESIDTTSQPTKRRFKISNGRIDSMPAKRVARNIAQQPWQREIKREQPSALPAPLNFLSTEFENNFRMVERIGSGTYGEVFKMINIKTNQLVAVKRLLGKIKSEEQMQMVGREINTLQSLTTCRNVIQLIEHMQPNRHQLTLVFEYCPFELQRLIHNRNVTFPLADVKALMLQLFEGLAFMHNKKILHRDIKTENILLTADGQLKIADFGLAREIVENVHRRNYTVNVVTLWYRAPELLLGDTRYCTGIDMWSAGCVMAEFFQRESILPGQSERDQIKLITRMCGSINAKVWPDVVKLNLFRSMAFGNNTPCRTREFMLRISKGNAPASDLFQSLLTLDPKHRISAFMAQNHDFFWMEPLPSDLKEFMVRARKVYSTS